MNEIQANITSSSETVRCWHLVADVEHPSLFGRDEISKWFTGLFNSINTERHDAIHKCTWRCIRWSKLLVLIAAIWLNLKYSTINMINKKVLYHIITCDDKNLQYLVENYSEYFFIFFIAKHVFCDLRANACFRMSDGHFPKHLTLWSTEWGIHLPKHVWINF